MPPRLLTHDGETLSLRAWAHRYGLSFKTFYDRLARGWSLDRALTTPVQEHRNFYDAILAYEARQREEGTGNAHAV